MYVVEPEAAALNLVLNIAPNDGLHAFDRPGKTNPISALSQCTCDHLRLFAHLEDDRFAVFNDGDTVVSFSRQPPDQRTVRLETLMIFEGST